MARGAIVQQDPSADGQRMADRSTLTRLKAGQMHWVCRTYVELSAVEHDADTLCVQIGRPRQAFEHYQLRYMDGGKQRGQQVQQIQPTE